MQIGSHRHRIVEAIRISSRPLDDDQLADRTGISPRQRVNQICRELEHAGMVRRRSGPDGKIVNEWVGDQSQHPETVPTASVGVSQAAVLADVTIQPAPELPAGSSREQRDAERVMLDLLSQQLGRELNPATLAIPSGERVQVDGADKDLSILAECWAHQGPTRARRRPPSAIKCSLTRSN
jgi:hypothetical protein